jgi:lipoprotein-anchoring transpeptidase ErfK/SrfK
MATRSSAGAALAAVALTLSACNVGGQGQETARAVDAPEAPPVTPALAPPALVPGPSAVAPAPFPPLPAEGLGPGVEGEPVRLLQERLVSLRYDPGTPSGHYSAATVAAVMAFQKVVGLPRTGAATPETIAALNRARDPSPLLPAGGATRIEVDLGRQVLFFYSAGLLTRILPVSTGNGRRYCAPGGRGVPGHKGRCGVAVTPSGSFRVERKVGGKRTSYLGVLYNPLYFKGGYAIHGAPSVPGHPASHGCVRIPMHSSRWLLDTVERGTPVYLIGGKYPAVPFPPDA